MVNETILCQQTLYTELQELIFRWQKYEILLNILILTAIQNSNKLT